MINLIYFGDNGGSGKDRLSLNELTLLDDSQTVNIEFIRNIIYYYVQKFQNVITLHGISPKQGQSVAPQNGPWSKKKLKRSLLEIQ